MIKFTIVADDGKTSIGLGISRENVNRLTAGRPIRVDLRELGVTVDDRVLIYFGENERELMDAVAEFITPETKVNIDPRMKGKMQ